MRKQKLVWFSAVLAACTCICAACGANNEASPEAKQAKNAYEIRVKQSATDIDEERSRATEQRLEQLAEGINEVKHANCVIIGDTAIVGIDVGGDIDRSHVGTIKYAVAEALRKDPVGINAIVTADMDLYHRLQEVREDIANGRPLQGMAEELADIVGRIIPQLPGDISPREDVPQEPKATTQEQGVNKAGSANNGTLPPSHSPQDNRSFQDHPSNP